MPDVPDRTDVTLRRTLRVLMPDGAVVPMEVEEYLRGVVPHEIGAGSPPEALKAQAVAARCYALTSRRHLDVGADVCTTTHCQVWKQETDPRSDAAVTETAAVVAVHNNRVINAFFFAHCDGQTRDIEDVWQAPPVAYLRGVSCPAPFPDLHGHGVGMCQEGAIAFGRQGGSYVDILTHFYTGIDVVRGAYEAAAEEEIEPVTRAGRYTVEIERRPGVRRILGTFPTSGIHFSVVDETGNRATLYSGLDAALGPGGWSLPAWRDGTFTIQVEEQRIPVEIHGDQVIVTFTEPSAEGSSGAVPDSVRIVSHAMDRPAAERLLADLSWYDAYEDVFSIESTTAGWALTKTERFASRRGIAGDLGVHGVSVVVADGDGNSVTAAGGTASAYGSGGFAVPVWRDGTFTVTVNGQSFPVEVDGDLVVLTLRQRGPTDATEAVRLVSRPMPAEVGARVIDGLNERFPGMFSPESR